jgi:hypothetical protein
MTGPFSRRQNEISFETLDSALGLFLCPHAGSSKPCCISIISSAAFIGVDVSNSFSKFAVCVLIRRWDCKSNRGLVNRGRTGVLDNLGSTPTYTTPIYVRPDTAPSCLTWESPFESCRRTAHNGLCCLRNWGNAQMKNKALIAAAAGLCLSLISSSGIAHHSFSAQFDAEKPLKLTGTVTKVAWRNPHAWFYIDVKDNDGNVANWGMELGSPNLLMRQGWSRSSMKIGEVVTVEGFHARDGSDTGNARVITLHATGKILSTKSSYKGGDK